MNLLCEQRCPSRFIHITKSSQAASTKRASEIVGSPNHPSSAKVAIAPPLQVHSNPRCRLCNWHGCTKLMWKFLKRTSGLTRRQPPLPTIFAMKSIFDRNVIGFICPYPVGPNFFTLQKGHGSWLFQWGAISQKKRFQLQSPPISQTLKRWPLFSSFWSYTRFRDHTIRANKGCNPSKPMNSVDFWAHRMKREFLADFGRHSGKLKTKA